MTNRQFAIRYIERIKNHEKKRYAAAYYRYLTGLYGKPNSDEYSIGAMCKQAVRMNLTEFLKEKEV